VTYRAGPIAQPIRRWPRLRRCWTAIIIALGVAKPEAAKAFEKIAELGEKGEGALKRSISGDNVTSVFTGRKTAFMISGPWQIPDLKKSGVKYDISPVPSFQGGKPARPFIGVQAMYVASKGRFKSLAQEFATNYFIQPDVAIALYKADQRPPPLKAAFAEVVKTDPDMAKVLAAGKGGDIMRAIPQMATVWDPLGKAEAAVIGGAPPGSTITAAANAIQSQIK
jgi:arabinogalactan oligomer/maltooligosaccharide transport system substrate-binding protein